MKKIIMIAAIAAMPAMGRAQAAIDVANMSQLDLHGTARFMAMGGAFTALGGDLSTLAQNPGGIGIYRSSELGITADINFQTFKAATDAGSSTKDQTKFNVNNFGYVGTVKMYSESCPTLSFGVTYQRANSFDRVFKGGMGLGGASLSNYVAAYTNSMGAMQDGYSPYSTYDLEWGSGYNPYYQSNAPWMSVLAYNGMIINEAGRNQHGQSMFQGLMGEGTTGSAAFDVREKGYIDEYNITVGGNVYNTFYWGVGFGITDIDYTQWTYYEEDLRQAYIEASDANGDWYGGLRGAAAYGLTNYLHSTGSGFNVKLGVILKPINELRFGLAFHTPTWYEMTDHFWGQIDYRMTPDDGAFNVEQGSELTNDSYDNWVDYKMRTPWRLMAGVAGVIGGQAIISADYEHRGANMQASDVDGNEYTDVTADVETYYKGTDIVRLGAEYRIDPQLSVRAGFSYETSPVEQRVSDGQENISFSGTIPSYSFNRATRYLTAGLGYRFGRGFSLDLAFVNKHRSSTWHAFSPLVAIDDLGQAYVEQASPRAKVTSDYNQLILSLSYKF